jgi:hypothetical protein
MNDPHVKALIFRVEHGPTVNYDKAQPLELEEPQFAVRIEANSATFEMKTHYARAEDALEVVEPFVRAWEMGVGLERGPDEFRLVYERPEIIERNPTPGSMQPATATLRLRANMDAVLTVGRSSYLPPSKALNVNPDVMSMYGRYTGHLKGKEPLASMAYFCLTVLLAGRDRAVAAKKYRISKTILTTLGRLATEKGGSEARKAEGVHSTFTSQEHKWIIAAVKSIIIRAAEVAYDPRQTLPQITLADLPPLNVPRES